MSEQSYGRYKEKAKRGCPTCDGVDPRSCMRCLGKTRMRDWVLTDSGWKHDGEEKQRRLVREMYDAADALVSPPSTTVSRGDK